MGVILPLLFLFTAVSGTAVVLVRDPLRQVFAIAINGLVLTILFDALQAPDVALSELAVGSAAVPLLFLVALMAVRTRQPEEKS
jgi:energy-converting hydrogenase B subunit D